MGQGGRIGKQCDAQEGRQLEDHTDFASWIAVFDTLNRSARHACLVCERLHRQSPLLALEADDVAHDLQGIKAGGGVTANGHRGGKAWSEWIALTLEHLLGFNNK